MKDYLKKDFAKILKQNALSGHRMMKATDSTCVRVYDRNIEELPVTVELYGKYARIVDFSDDGLEDEDEIKDIASRYLYVESGNIIYRHCKKREGREQHEKGEESLRTVVRESGHEFEVELLKYNDTGLFLDHAETRRLVEASTMNRSVLNLFSYTGSFSVYAAAGGAEEVTSVDLSNVYTQWAKENLERNGYLDEDKYPCICQDANTFLKERFEKGMKWDLVIFDPPSFSNSNKAVTFDVKKDYKAYLLVINALLKDSGRVIFSENLSSFDFDKKDLRRFYKIDEITEDVKAIGFTRRSTMRCYLLEKIYDSKEFIMKRIDDDFSLERLSFGSGKEKRTTNGSYGRKEGQRRDGWKDRRPREERREWRERDERPRFNSDRPGHSRFEKRDSFDKRDERRSYDRSYRDERPRRDRDDWRERRPRYEDERRRFDGTDEKYPRRRFHDDDLPDYRNRRPFRERRDDDEYPRERRPFRERRFDSDRPRRERSGMKPYRGREEREDYRSEGKREFGERKTHRKPPVPYGMDDFRSSKKKD